MEFDFADLLMEVISRRASDLHLAAGAAPSVRVRGRLTPMDGYPRLSPADTREIVYSILTNDQRQKLETDWQLDFAYSIPGVARFRVNAYFQRSALGAAFRTIPAETGHLVFATLHTQSAPQTIDRIIDVFPTAQQDQVRTQLSVALQGVMTQQLLPTADGSARVVACEVLVPTPAVRNLIREGKTHQIPSAMQTGSSVGMQTMDSALAQLVRAGKITQRLAEQRASSPEELRRLTG